MRARRSVRFGIVKVLSLIHIYSTIGSLWHLSLWFMMSCSCFFKWVKMLVSQWKMIVVVSGQSSLLEVICITQVTWLYSSNPLRVASVLPIDVRSPCKQYYWSGSVSSHLPIWHANFTLGNRSLIFCLGRTQFTPITDFLYCVM